MNEKRDDLIDSLGSAINRLQEALEIRPDSSRISIDASIQRFEFTFELLWKAVKIHLSDIGIEANSPRAVFQEAYQQHWIDDADLWLHMMKDRNLTSHTYHEATADDIYADIKGFLGPIQKLYMFLKGQNTVGGGA